MRNRPPLLRTVALLGAAFSICAVLVAFFVPLERVVVGEGAFSGPSRAVRAPRAGRLADVLAEAGERVEAGQVLARLDASAFEPQRREFAAQRAALGVRREQLARERAHAVAQTHPAAREVLVRAEESAVLVLEAAQAKERRYGELRNQGLVEAAEFEEAVLARRLTEVELAGVRAKRAERAALEAAELASLDAESSTLGQEFEQLAAREAELDLLAGRSEIVAPVAGRLLGPQRAELVGRAVVEGEELLRVAVAGVEAFVAYVDDRGRARVQVGQSAKLRLSGYPWLVHGSLGARVIEVADRADERGYRVRLEVDGAGELGPLFEGMRGRARIATKQRAPIAWLLLEEAFGLGGS
jgi:HlyD family secretion protein